MSADTQTPKSELLEPYQIEGGKWRVDSTCPHCQTTIFLDSDEKPNELALKLARFAFACDPCALEQQKAEERSTARRGLDDRIREAGLPNALQSLSWDDMDRSSGRLGVIAAGRAWAEHPRGRVLIYGPAGTGKTRLAATAAWQKLQLGPLTWMPVTQLVQAAFMPSQSVERVRFNRAALGKGPLVLDDLGKEKPGEWARQVLFGAIDARLQAGAPILVTSNFDPDELAERLGDTFGSRLQLFRQFELGGRDRREPDPEPRLRKDLE